MTCDECGKSKQDGWALYCVSCLEKPWVGLAKNDVIKAMRESGMSFHLGMSHEVVIYQLTRFANTLGDLMKEKNA